MESVLSGSWSMAYVCRTEPDKVSAGARHADGPGKDEAARGVRSGRKTNLASPTCYTTPRVQSTGKGGRWGVNRSARWRVVGDKMMLVNVEAIVGGPNGWVVDTWTPLRGDANRALVVVDRHDDAALSARRALEDGFGVDVPTRTMKLHEALPNLTGSPTNGSTACRGFESKEKRAQSWMAPTWNPSWRVLLT